MVMQNLMCPPGTSRVERWSARREKEKGIIFPLKAVSPTWQNPNPTSTCWTGAAPPCRPSSTLLLRPPCVHLAWWTRPSASSVGLSPASPQWPPCFCDVIFFSLSLSGGRVHRQLSHHLSLWGALFCGGLDPGAAVHVSPRLQRLRPDGLQAAADLQEGLLHGGLLPRRIQC